MMLTFNILVVCFVNEAAQTLPYLNPSWCIGYSCALYTLFQLFFLLVFLIVVVFASDIHFCPVLSNVVQWRLHYAVPGIVYGYRIDLVYRCTILYKYCDENNHHPK